MTDSSPQDEEIQQPERYTALCDRAVEFIANHGNAVPEDILIAHIFGASGPPSLWRSLLRSVLEPDDRLLFRGTGEWFIPSDGAESPLSAPLLTEFVALDVETTGLKPSRQRIIEVALVRYRDGVAERSFESLLNPGRVIPEFITRLTTIRNEDVADAPEFSYVAQDILDFLGDSIIVGHNVAFDIGFLNAELGRLDLPPLVNDRIDTMGLAMRLLREIRKPSLDHVAAAVGLNPRRVHRAGGDARLTAEVALRLTNRAASEGITDLDRLKATAHVVTPRPRDDVGRARSVMDRSLAREMPKKPGVYIMRDERGEIVYVGKARNLRDRVSSYYSQPIGYTRKLDGLIESVRRIDHEVVGSELEALLLEAQFIRRYQPRYNTALKKSEHYPYIRVDVTNPFPRVLLARNRRDDDARYFGPYRSASTARKTVDIINAILPLRSCTRSFKNHRSYGKPCVALDLHQCLGPCTGKVDQSEYRAVVEDVLALLEGRDDGLYRRIHDELEVAAEKQDYERAARIRRNILNLTSILEEQQRIREAERLHYLALVLPGRTDGAREVMLILKGRLWARFGIDPAADDVIDDLRERLASSLVRYAETTLAPPDHHDIDQASILTRFLFRNADNPALVLLDVTDDGAIASDPFSIARRILDVADDAIAALDVRRAIEAESEVEGDAGASDMVAPLTVEAESLLDG